MGLFNNFLNQVATGDIVSSYKHASRLFLDFDYALMPKSGWLFHVFFDLNPSLTFIDNMPTVEAGMLVKSVDLPKFTFDTRISNNYNRPNIVQTKIKYDQIQIVFHDDMSNVVRNLWFDYYNYYYRDADAGYDGSSGGVNPTYQASNRYKLGQRDMLNRFGYSPRSKSITTQYLQSIRIYSLYKKKFSEYTLVNPTISAFSHGSHATESSNSLLEHTMTVQYESVLYSSGYTSVNTVKGFADLHYDKSPSPLSVAGGGTNSILGPGGILAAADEITKDGTAGNFGSAAFKLLRAREKNKNVNLAGLAKGELLVAANDLLAGKNPADRFFVPHPGGNAGWTTPPTALTGRTNTALPGSVTSNGSSLNTSNKLATLGTAIAVAGKPALGAGIAVAGLLTNSSGTVQGGAFNKVVNVSYNSPLVVVGSKSPADEFSYKKSIDKIQKQTADEVNAAGLGNNGLPTITATINTPVFDIGTSTSTSIANPLALTPYAASYVPAQVDVVNKNAGKFVNNGNPVQILPDNTGLSTTGTSTPPAPSSIG